MLRPKSASQLLFEAHYAKSFTATHSNQGPRRTVVNVSYQQNGKTCMNRYVLNHKRLVNSCHGNNVVCVRNLATEQGQHKSGTSSGSQEPTGREIDIKRKSAYEGLSMGEKVKEAGKDFSYLTVAVAALGVLGAMFYFIGRELFSGMSPNGIYNRAYKRCKEDTEVKIALGTPIAGYGETSRRGRRRHVSHQEYVNETDGKKHMRMQFYIEGPDKKATVHLEMQESNVPLMNFLYKNDSKQYEYRYLFVQLDEFPYRTIVLEDNR